MSDWNAELYNRYYNQRLQPVTDLIRRLDQKPEYRRIIDIGCGTGISTLPLRNRWPQAKITGVDNSESMLTKARESCSDVDFVKRDCTESLKDLGKFDLIFSNAVLQWLPDQAAVIKNLSELLTEEGTLAIQVPNFKEMAINTCIQEAADSFGAEAFRGVEKEQCICYDPEYYYDILASCFVEVEVWQTNYYHIMNSHNDILDFYKSTGLRPFLDRLDAEGKDKFLAEVLNKIKVKYSTRKDDKVLFEFKRIFLLAEKPQ